MRLAQCSTGAAGSWRYPDWPPRRSPRSAEDGRRQSAYGILLIRLALSDQGLAGVSEFLVGRLRAAFALIRDSAIVLMERRSKSGRVFHIRR